MEKAQHTKFNVPHVARLQFDSCAERHSLCGTVMIPDGLNLRCLDQCHGVRSHGTSSSPSWRKRIVVQSKFDPLVYITKVMYTGLTRESFPGKIGKGRHWTPMCICGCASNGQDSPKASQSVIFN